MKHLDVLITFVRRGLVKEHVEMITNMIDLEDEYKVSATRFSRYRIILSYCTIIRFEVNLMYLSFIQMISWSHGIL